MSSMAGKLKLSENSGNIEFRGTLCTGLWEGTLSPALSQREREQEIPLPPLGRGLGWDLCYGSSHFRSFETLSVASCTEAREAR